MCRNVSVAPSFHLDTCERTQQSYVHHRQVFSHSRLSAQYWQQILQSLAIVPRSIEKRDREVSNSSSYYGIRYFNLTEHVAGQHDVPAVR